MYISSNIHIHHNFSGAAHPVATTPAQLLLRWTLQHNMAVLPRSSNPERLRENLQSLAIQPLSAAEMSVLDTLQYLVASPLCKPIDIVA